MNKVKSKKHVFILLIFTLIISIMMGFLINKLISYENYKNNSSFINAFLLENPNLEEEVFTALKLSMDKPVDYEINVLEQYGYTYNTFSSTSYKGVLFISSISVLMLLLLFLAILILQRKRNLSRIQSLSNYLSKINHTGQENILIPIEDDFSILEDEIYKTIMELKTTKESALKERNILADNLADISHQLKTPIAAISLMVQLIDTDTGEDQVYIDKIKFQIDRIEYLISTLLKLSKLDAGAVNFENANINMYSLICQVTEQIEPLATSKSLDIQFEESSNVSIIGDRNWIGEALTNILKNCCEHTPEGGRINISYFDNPLYAEIVITDSGFGFSKEDLPNLFKRFYKGKNTDKNSLGIGLALSKTIIENQDGLIKAENNHLGGGKFIIKFYKK